MSEKLKPCPLCGERVEVKKENYNEDQDVSFGIECSECFCNVSFYSTREKAIKAWNTRHVPEGYKLVPLEATAENGMKAALIGEYKIKRTFIDEEGEEIERDFTLTWSEMKELYRLMLTAAPDVGS